MLDLMAKVQRPGYRELTWRTHPCHSEPLDGALHEELAMTEVSPPTFSPEMVTLMRSALDTAVDQIDQSHRTPATKAKMAQRIVKTASKGVTDLRALTSAALDEGRCLPHRGAQRVPIWRAIGRRIGASIQPQIAKS
jgi:hypothetical protein